MNKRMRQYVGILAAIIMYYIVHEGAHLLYALSIGVFKEIHFMGLGVQVDVYADQMTDLQMGIFCLVGAIATFLVGGIMILLRKKIGKLTSKVIRAVLYYCTIMLLFLDPIYLSVLCGFFGGGDMNGISMLLPEIVARIGFGMLLIVNGLVFWKVVLPEYQASFQVDASI